MKIVKTLSLLLCALLLLSACGGDVSGVTPVIGSSSLYEEAEIMDAMDMVLDYFQKEFSGCRLTRLEYDEIARRDEMAEWAEQYDEEEAIVLISDFDVGPTGGDGSLNANSTYRNWKWILTRSDDGGWILRTWGYG